MKEIEEKLCVVRIHCEEFYRKMETIPILSGSDMDVL